MAEKQTVVLGGGMTGLGVGLASRDTIIYEATERPGGICSSYYLRPDSTARLTKNPRDGNAYRFEIGGGHWIFGGDPIVHRLLRNLVDVKQYQRRSGCYIPSLETYVPYPIQNNLRCLPDDIASDALSDMIEANLGDGPTRTMAQWLESNFGKTLCDLFFHPFHELYTAGLWRDIAPQDPYKSPVNIRHATTGALKEPPSVGYNVQFVYPENGLDSLARAMASRANIQYGMRAVNIDANRREVYFENGKAVKYNTLISTLPLNKMVKMLDVDVEGKAYPSPSVLVINIGATKGDECPNHHWLYIPESQSGFHRVGFYSHVDDDFIPADRSSKDAVSIYVEMAFRQDDRPDIQSERMDRIVEDVISELQDWGWIDEVEVADPTMIEVAYTWSWPDSSWREESLRKLQEAGIYQVGRYARWVFQGIAESIADGLMAGGSLTSDA